MLYRQLFLKLPYDHIATTNSHGRNPRKMILFACSLDWVGLTIYLEDSTNECHRIRSRRQLAISMSFVIKATTNSRKASFLTLFIPLFDPIAGTNGSGKLTQRLAFVVARLTGTQDPFIVSIPTMQGLVLMRETIVMRRRTGVFDLLQMSHFFLIERRRLLRKNLNDVRASERCNGSRER